MDDNKKPLRILYIAHERKLGGATRSLLALIDEMKLKGHEIYVIVPTGKCPLSLELKRRGISVIPVFFAWWQMPSYWNMMYKLAFKLLYIWGKVQVYFTVKKLRTLHLDLIHTNSSVTDFGAKLAEKLNVKHIWHIREYGDVDYNLEYMFGKEKTWEYLNEHTEKIIFISNDLYKYFQGYVDTAKSKVIYNGISREYLIEKEYRDKKTVTFLTAGNLNRNKQQMLVLQAANELIRRGVDNFKVLLAGAATSMQESKHYERELRDYAEKFLGQNVTFLGSVSDMPGLRKQVDIEVVPSTREAFGRVTVEAMFAGMPVIASDSGANVELVDEGVTGMLFVNGDHITLADRMQFFIENPTFIREWGKKAHESAIKKYTSERNAELVEEVYYLK